MINAIVLAGGKSKVTLEDLIGRVIEYPFYREWYLFGKYKPLIEVGGEIEGIRKRRPVIEYPLHALMTSNNIGEIVIVGDKKKLEKGLDIPVKNYGKRCNIIQQVGSLKDNALHAYKSLGTKGHTLIVTADAALITKQALDNFAASCEKDFDKYDVFYPIISKKYLKEYEPFFPTRKYFKVIDDINNESADFKEKNMRGFRISNMAIANPDNVKNLDFIDFAYSARKMRNPMNIIKLLGLFREELLIKYPQGKLKLSEIQDKVSDLLGTRLKFVEVKDAGTSLDMDAYEDQRIIEKINGFSNDKSQT